MSKEKILVRFFGYKVSFTIIVFVLLLIIFGIFSTGQTFFRRENLYSLGRLAPDLGIVSLGVGTLMISGQFDLSVSSTIPMSSFIFVKLLGWGAPLVVMLVATLCVGAFIGVTNGLLVVKTKLPSFIITLGRYSICVPLRAEKQHNWLKSQATALRLLLLISIRRDC